MKSHSNLGGTASPPLTAENNYVTKSPLVTMRCPTFTPSTIFTPSIYILIPRLTPHNIEMAVLSQYTSGQTDRLTDKPTDRTTHAIDDGTVSSRLMVSKRLKISTSSCNQPITHDIAPLQLSIFYWFFETLPVVY